MCGNVAKDGSATQYTETQKEVMCKRELATMFAHFGQEVGKHDPTSAAATPANGGVHKARQGLYVFTEGFLNCCPSFLSYGAGHRSSTYSRSSGYRIYY